MTLTEAEKDQFARNNCFGYLERKIRARHIIHEKKKDGRVFSSADYAEISEITKVKEEDLT